MFYKDSQVEPRLGDVVRNSHGIELRVGSVDLEKRKRMFTDCVANDILGLNNPEKFEFIRRGKPPVGPSNFNAFKVGD